MRMRKYLKPELCCAKDETRADMELPFLDREAKVIVATDGHMLCIFPVEIEEGDEDKMFISREAIEYARKQAGRHRPHDYLEMQMFVDVQLLKRAADALGCKELAIDVPDNESEPIYVRRNNRPMETGDDKDVVLVMPMRNSR